MMRAALLIVAFACASAAVASGPVTSISVDYGRTCIIAGGKAYCYGVNTVDNKLPMVPRGFVDARQIAVSPSHTCALDRDGAWCWGSDNNGETDVPLDLRNPSQIAVTNSRTCAIDDSGLRCWGRDTQGKLAVPADLLNPREVALSYNISCAIADSGVRCWGYCPSGSCDVPAGIVHPRGLAVGPSSACVIDDGGLKCWGQLPFAEAPALKNPRQVSLLDRAICVIDDTGVHCWGDDPALPIQPPGDLGQPIAVVMAGDHACAEYENDVRCWSGRYANDDGQTGFPTHFGKFAEIVLGDSFSCIRDEQGLKCWGARVPIPNPYNPAKIETVSASGRQYCWVYSGDVQCFGFDAGDVPFFPRRLLHVRKFELNGGQICAIDDMGFACRNPIPIQPKGTVRDFAIGGGPSGCLLDDEGVKCWGYGDDFPMPPKMKNPQSVVAGIDSACALDDDGVRCWGRTGSPVIKVPTLTHPRMLVGGFYHACVVDDLGVRCWGSNRDGQIAYTPTGLTNVKQLIAGGWNTCAISGAGLQCWGYNGDGASDVPADLGPPSPIERRPPL